MRTLIAALFVCCLSLAAYCSPWRPVASASADSDTDHDGLSDTFEATLLAHFAPEFMIDRHDCSVKPALFAPFAANPHAVNENGAIYGQAFPRAFPSQAPGEIELHYYDLWRTDCGRMGHPLDAEHVSVLLRGHGSDVEDWRAIYWYAAAHEDTVCDASQMTRASTLHAETHGARVWISQGKHAAFLDETLCRRGCGGDRCPAPQSLSAASIINLGELSAATNTSTNTLMNGAIWASSPRWPLADKMRRSDFTTARLQRLDRLPATDVAWAEPALRPVEGAVRGGNATIDGALTGGSSTSGALALSRQRTDTALVLAGDRTGNALDRSTRNTGNALTRSYRNVRGALGSAAGHTVDALQGNGSAAHDTKPH